MNKRWFLILLFMLLLTSIAFGQTALPCTETSNTGNELQFSNMLLNTYQQIAVFGEDEKWGSFTSIIPNETQVLQKNETETVTGGSTTTLDWDIINFISIRNTTGADMPSVTPNVEVTTTNRTVGNWTTAANVADGNLSTNSGLAYENESAQWFGNFTAPECAVRASTLITCRGSDLASYDTFTPPAACWGSNLQLKVNLSNTTSPYNLTYECYNSTGGLVSLGNYNATVFAGCYVNWSIDVYSISEVTGVLTWPTSCWDTDTVYVSYNKTINGSVDLTSYTTKWTVDGNTSWNENTRWAILTADLNNTGWNTTYSYTDRNCAGRDSCRNTQIVVYAAFALIALFAIVGAAFFIISMFSGGNIGTAAGGALVVGVIGIGIIVMIGYYIISAVGLNVCFP